MAKSLANLFNWGAGAEGINAGVWVAPASAASAAAASAASGASGTPGAPYAETGWISDQGVTEGHTVNATQKFGWQTGGLLKNLKTSEARTFKFQAMEENAVIMGLLRPGSTVTTASGVTHTVVKSSLGSDVRNWVVQLIEGNVTKRFWIPQGEVTTYADISYLATDFTVYEFTISVYPTSGGNYYEEWSTAPGVAVS